MTPSWPPKPSQPLPNSVSSNSTTSTQHIQPRRDYTGLDDAPPPTVPMWSDFCRLLSHGVDMPGSRLVLV